MAAGLITETVDGIEFGFDFDAERIDVGASADVLSVETLWTAIKLAQWHMRSIEYGTIADGGGLDALGDVDGDTVASYLTVSLRGGWEINSLKTSGKFTVTGGNLIKENGDDPFLDNPLITYFLFLSQSGTVARVSVGSGVTPSDVTAIGAEVEGRILSDGQAFHGANIDAPVSTSGGLTLDQATSLALIESLVTEVRRLSGYDASNPVTITRDEQGRIASVSAGSGHVVNVTHGESDETWERES